MAGSQLKQLKITIKYLEEKELEMHVDFDTYRYLSNLRKEEVINILRENAIRVLGSETKINSILSYNFTPIQSISLSPNQTIEPLIQ